MPTLLTNRPVALIVRTRRLNEPLREILRQTYDDRQALQSGRSVIADDPA